MEDLIINGNIINIKNPEQIINMGGPWVGELFINNIQVSDNVILDNFIPDKGDNVLYFVKYHKISENQRDNYFSVNFIILDSLKISMYDLKFQMIYIEEIRKNKELIYYNAFHDENTERKKIIDISNVKIIN